MDEKVILAYASQYKEKYFFNDELGMHLAKIGVDAMTCNHAAALREKYRNFLSAAKNN